jgi:hypothetical protein
MPYEGSALSRRGVGITACWISSRQGGEREAPAHDAGRTARRAPCAQRGTTPSCAERREVSSSPPLLTSAHCAASSRRAVRARVTASECEMVTTSSDAFGMRRARQLRPACMRVPAVIRHAVCGAASLAALELLQLLRRSQYRTARATGVTHQAVDERLELPELALLAFTLVPEHLQAPGLRLRQRAARRCARARHGFDLSIGRQCTRRCSRAGCAYTSAQRLLEARELGEPAGSVRDELVHLSLDLVAEIRRVRADRALGHNLAGLHWYVRRGHGRDGGAGAPARSPRRARSVARRVRC